MAKSRKSAAQKPVRQRKPTDATALPPSAPPAPALAEGQLPDPQVAAPPAATEAPDVLVWIDTPSGKVPVAIAEGSEPTPEQIAAAIADAATHDAPRSRVDLEQAAYGLRKAELLTRHEVRIRLAAAAEAGKTRLFPRRDNYATVKLSDGRNVVDNGDRVARELRNCAELSDVIAHVASVMGEAEVTELMARYAKLNPGMQRMNLGNKLRGFYAKGAPVDPKPKAKKPLPAAPAVEDDADGQEDGQE